MWKIKLLETRVRGIDLPSLLQVFLPPGVSKSEALAKPFHVYDDAFYDIIGANPTLTVIASQGVNPLFHEAVVW